MTRRIPLFFISLMTALLLAACGGDSSSDSASAAADAADSPVAPAQTAPAQAELSPSDVPGDAEPALPLAEDGEQIVARVNSQPITLDQFQRAVDRSQGQVPDVASYDALAELELTKLIEQEIINQAAAEMGLSVTQAQIDAEYQAMRELVPDDAAWQRWLMDNRFISEAEFLDVTADTLITQAVQLAVIEPEGTRVPQVRMRHILVATEDDARGILAQLDAGADFGQLAANFSLDETSRINGGDLGVDGDWIVREDLIVPELFDAALTLAPGDYTGPVASGMGFHVVQTLAVGERLATTQEQAARNRQQFDAWLQAQLAAAEIERYILR